MGSGTVNGAIHAGPSQQAPHALELRDVHRRYGDFEAVRGLSPITTGSIHLLGMDVATELHRIQPRIGVQLQQNNYFKFLTVQELLRFYQELHGSMDGKRGGWSLDSLLERLELKEKLNAKVDTLSGGQLQRLSIAIALLGDPDVLFLDEPTSALDPHSRISTWTLIEDLKRQKGKTVILTTHYMEEAERLCDEILLMDRGKVIAQGNPSQLVQSLGAKYSVEVEFGHGQFKPELLGNTATEGIEWDERTACLRLRTPKLTNTLRDVLALTQNAQIEVTKIDINRPTLEEVFLSHTGKGLAP
jgi:ABC-2 type transport system ATP-binding protein